MDKPNEVELFKSAAHSGDLNTIKELYNKNKIEIAWNSTISNEAALAGELDLFIWLIEHRCPIDTNTLEHSIRGGNINIVLIVLNDFPEKCKFDPRLYVSAIISHNLHLLELLYKRRCECTDNAALTASSLGNILALEWINGHNFPIPAECIDQAVSNGHKHIVNWLLEHDYKSTDQTLYNIIENGDSELFHIFIEQDVEIMPDICDIAANSGNIIALKWATEHDYKWSTKTFSNIITNGYIEIADWFISHGEPITSEHCWLSAKNGRLDMLIWLLSKDAKCDADTCFVSAMVGNLNILRYLHMIGCEWDYQDCLYVATNNGHTDVMNWITPHTINNGDYTFI